MRLQSTKKYKYGNGADRKFWGCSRWPNCKATHGAHPDGSPVGIPADKETKALRVKAHESFDGLMKKNGVHRGSSYFWLGAMLGIPLHKIGEECHIGRFDAETCKQVIQLCAEEKEREK